MSDIDSVERVGRWSKMRVLRAAVQFLSLAWVLALPTVAHGSEPRPLARTDAGWVQGVRVSGVDQFLSVPYAAPPLDTLRWRPPVSVAPWRGLRDASTLPMPCVQFQTQGSEDCLYLNVYRPAHPRRPGRLPVLFWIHGGALAIGSSADYDASALATTTDTVVVTLNYRLGKFGFLALPSLGVEAADGTSGEYGLMDQQQALRWVQRNIGAFGGDPRRITIEGQSAGGFSVCAHLASPAAAGLFSGAILQSAACLSMPLADAEERGRKFAEAAGCADPQTAASCLRQKTADELLASDTYDLATLPVSGGRLLPVGTFDAVSSGDYNRVPVVIGNVHDEARVGVLAQAAMTQEEYAGTVQAYFGDLASLVLSEYPSEAYGRPAYAWSAILSDSGSVGIGSCTTRRLAAIFAAYGPTYVYEFDDPDAPPPNWAEVPEGFQLGSSHSSELAYLFEPSRLINQELTPIQKGLSRQLMRYFGAFAERGAPEAWWQPFWPRYEGQDERVLRLRPGATRVLTDFSSQHHCDFWSSLLG